MNLFTGCSIDCTGILLHMKNAQHRLRAIHHHAIYEDFKCRVRSQVMYKSTQIQDACKRRVAGTVFGTQDAFNMAFTE